jgi:UPF0755 protein
LKRARRLVGIGIAAALLAGAGGVWWAWRQLQPVSRSAQPVRVAIKPGTGAEQIARQLEREGVIRNASLFLLYAYWKGDAGRFKPGIYRLSPDMSAAQIADLLQRGAGDPDDITVTIPEGFTLSQIAQTLKERGVLRDAQAFVKMCRSASAPLSAPFALPKSGLEGYLYPETYRFHPQSAPEKVAQTMLDAFTREFYTPHRAEIRRSPHSLHQIVTMAAMIEREASAPQDRARIAGVIENRLKRGMRLQIDATVLYALGRHKERVLYRDLQVDSPYNTYRRAGLPPGPIASPGKLSLQAALRPERHDYLFYVAKPDGSHLFTRTLAEHEKAVRQMRALRRRSAGGGEG